MASLALVQTQGKPMPKYPLPPLDPPYHRESIAEALERHDRDREWAVRQIHARHEVEKLGAPRELLDVLVIEDVERVIGWIQAYVLHLGPRPL